MDIIEKRRETIRDLQVRGIAIPDGCYLTIEKDCPGPLLRKWLWWAAIWPRPKTANWQSTDFELQAAQDQWDASKQHIDHHNEWAAERAAREAQEAERARLERAQQRAERQQAAEAALRAELQMHFMAANPGASDADFETVYPALKQRHQIQRMEANMAESRANAGKYF